MPEANDTLSNPEFELAEQFALHTRKHCFITGKAGTGKTTLLKRVVERTRKNVVVVAPTGVAAINAGGVTIHSMFGLPLTCFVPSDDFVDLNLATNRLRLQQDHVHYRKDKLRVLRELDTLIIDEVSMVRSDLLDAVDFALRTVRRSDRPFGDVQVLLFGDMHQLPPVVRQPEWSILQAYYRSPYFFDSHVWPQLNASEIELKTIYRQSDERFLKLLNHIRERKMDEDDRRCLQDRYHPNFKPTEKGYVLLSTHNYAADSVNTAELEKLPGPMHSFKPVIEGDFPQSLFPCDPVLHLKTGAQVMFIRNDTVDGAYYNGRLAVVKKIRGEDITVTFNDSGQDFLLHREKWENIEYKVDEETGEIIRNELGTFSQFPLRLAWAITIHKSQGLTFDKVIIDAGRSFAAGQVYVALSRCRSLEGIVLHSLIPPAALLNDERIGEFSARHHALGDLRDLLVREKARYANYQLLRLFTLPELSGQMDEWRNLIAKKDVPDKDAAWALHAQSAAHVRELDEVALKFRRQLERILAGMETNPTRADLLKERCEKAIGYFTGRLAAGIADPLREHINGLAYKKKMKRYLAQVQLIEEICRRKIDQLYAGRFMEEKLYRGEPVHAMRAVERVVSSATSGSKAKGGTFRDTLALYRQGKSLEEIAKIRGLTLGSIRSHMARLIECGEVDVYEVLPAETIERVMAFLQGGGPSKLGEIRSGLGNQYHYDDIRMVLSHASRHSREKAVPLSGKI